MNIREIDKEWKRQVDSGIKNINFMEEHFQNLIDIALEAYIEKGEELIPNLFERDIFEDHQQRINDIRSMK